MVRNRSKQRRGGGGRKKLSLAMVAGFAPLGIEIYDGVKAEGLSAVPKRLAKLAGYNAYEKKFELRIAGQVWPGIIAGALVHKGANILGINRMLPKWLPVSI